MKTLFRIIGVAALLGLATVTNAQTSNTVAAVEGFGTTVGQWFTSENPANRFQDAQLWTGAIDQNSAPVANEVGASYDIWRQHADYFPYTAATNQSASSIYAAIEGRERTSQIGVMSFGAGPQLGWMQNDVRIGIFVEPVYRLDAKHSHYRAEFGAQAEKMLTANSAIGILVSQQTHEKTPFVGANFTVSFGNGSGFLGLFNSPKPSAP